MGSSERIDTILNRTELNFKCGNFVELKATLLNCFQSGIDLEKVK